MYLLLGPLLFLKNVVIMSDWEQSRMVEFTFPEAHGYMEGSWCWDKMDFCLGRMNFREWGGHWSGNQECLPCVLLQAMQTEECPPQIRVQCEEGTELSCKETERVSKRTQLQCVFQYHRDALHSSERNAGWVYHWCNMQNSGVIFIDSVRFSQWRVLWGKIASSPSLLSNHVITFWLASIKLELPGIPSSGLKKLLGGLSSNMKHSCKLTSWLWSI